MSLRRIASRPMFLSEPNCFWLKHVENPYQRRTAGALAVESGRAFWQLTDAISLGSADAPWIKRGKVVAASGAHVKIECRG